MPIRKITKQVVQLVNVAILVIIKLWINNFIVKKVIRNIFCFLVNIYEELQPPEPTFEALVNVHVPMFGNDDEVEDVHDGAGAAAVPNRGQDNLAIFFESTPAQGKRNGLSITFCLFLSTY